MSQGSRRRNLAVSQISDMHAVGKANQNLKMMCHNAVVIMDTCHLSIKDLWCLYVYRSSFTEEDVGLICYGLK